MASGLYKLSSANKDINGISLESNVSYSNSIKIAIKNLLMLNKLDILNYNPLKGISLKKYIGKPIDALTVYNISSQIKRTLAADESRINNVQVQISYNNEYNGLIIQLNYIEKLLGTSQTLVLNYEL